MNRPSLDHCDRTFGLSLVSNDSSGALPVAAFMKRLKTPFRVEANATRSLFDDQNGVPFVDASVVSRVSVPRVRSRSHRSDAAPFARMKTTDFSSDEIAGRLTKPSVPTSPSSFPLRS